MHPTELLPAILLFALATGTVAAARLLPEGVQAVLVRLDAGDLARLDQPALAGVALLDLPAPGFAVLHGDAALIRAALGLAIAWKGLPSCTPSP